MGIMDDVKVLCAWEGTAFQGALWDITLACVISLLANLVVATSDILDWFTQEMHNLLTIPVIFLLVFRTNFAVGRYFEGRALVGKMVRHAALAWIFP